MSETAAEGQGGNTSGETPAASEFKPITSQDDLNKIIGERVKRTEAKFSDYNDLKAKAEQLDALAEASQTEAEKTEKRIAKAEAEVASVPAKVSAALRDHLVKIHEIDQERADLFLTATDPELLIRQVNGLLGDADNRRKSNNIVPREGSNPTPKAGDAHEAVRQLFG